VIVFDHLFSDNLDLISKVAEVGLAASSLGLYRLDAD